jgi:phage tail-like protein
MILAIAERRDPYQSFNFLIEVQGLIAGGFSEVSGIQIETEVEDIKEGGVNDHVHKLPKATKYPNVAFKRGITDSDTLWRWHQDVIAGRFERRTVFVVLRDASGDEKWRWSFIDAYPVKWIGPDLKADSSAVAIESLELAHNGFKKI